MKFLITSTSESCPYRMEHKYPELHEYGYEEKKSTNPKYFNDAYVEINTLEELIRLMHGVNQPLILSPLNYNANTGYEIEIYDCSREL